MVVMPIITLYFIESGLSIRDIFVLQVIFSVAIVVLEVPSGYFADVFGRKGSLILGVIVGTAGFLMYYLALGIKYLALAIIPLFWVLRGVFQPIALDYINRETDSSTRATVVSISQLFGRAFFSVLSPFLGWIADVWSLEVAFAASAIVFGILSVFSFLLLYSRMKKGPKMYGTT